MGKMQRIILDLDGPLLDGKEKHYFCYRTILKKFGIEPVSADEYWAQKRTGKGLKALLKLSNAEEFYDGFCAAWQDLIESSEALLLDKVQEGAVDCLRGWKEEGVKLTLVTMRKDKQALEEQLKMLGLRPFFDAVLVCDQTGGGNKAGVIRETYPSHTFKEHTLWVGDTEADWKGARSLECKITLLSNGLRNEEYLRSLAGASVKSSISSLANIGKSAGRNF